MSELRLNILNGNWTVIATERGQKPESFKVERGTDIRDLDVYDPDCPFCPGNEERFDIRPLRDVSSPDGTWQTRLIENKYKIFDDHAVCPVMPEPFTPHGVHFSYKGCGNHFLVLEHPAHNRVTGTMTPQEVASVFTLYLDAVTRLSKNPNNLISILFKNQGAAAGASQPHAHSQIVGSRVVPGWIRTAMHIQQQYFDQHGECALCAMLEFELKARERIVADTGEMVILSPYAASAPYELWVVPKRHFACYNQITASEITALAAAVQQALGAYVEKLDNPDFNYFLHSSPHPLAGVPFYHFFVQIVPRLWNNGGFETGTGMAVNPIVPETVPQLLGETQM
jgi:UDPglucose--hexose-1-phosphate uridylyltransferase